jgi:hypothetical protein
VIVGPAGFEEVHRTMSDPVDLRNRYDRSVAASQLAPDGDT